MLNIRSLQARLENLFSGELCGLNAKEGTVVAGLFMLMVSIMQLIFQAGHFRYLQPLSTSSASQFTSLQIYCIGTITFTCLTFVAIVVLFVSVWKEMFWGVAGYITWIFFNEIAQLCFLSILLPSKGGFPRSVQGLEWFGFIMRLLSHFFWMIFVVGHAIDLYKISRNTEDPSKSKQKTPPKLKFAKVMELAV